MAPVWGLKLFALFLGVAFLGDWACMKPSFLGMIWITFDLRKYIYLENERSTGKKGKLWY